MGCSWQMWGGCEGAERQWNSILKHTGQLPSCGPSSIETISRRTSETPAEFVVLLVVVKGVGDRENQLLQSFFYMIFQFSSLCRVCRVRWHLSNYCLFLETAHPLSTSGSRGTVGPNKKPFASIKGIYKLIQCGS